MRTDRRSGFRGDLLVRLPRTASNRRKSQFELIHSSARLVIGLWNTTLLGEAEIGALIGRSSSEVSRFLKQIQADDLGQHMLMEGFPAIYGVAVPGEQVLECASCGGQVVWVPCVKCWSAGILPRELAGFSGDEDLPDCGLPTSAQAGSLQKVSVMRMRVSQGYSAFCEGDETDIDGASHRRATRFSQPEDDETDFDAYLGRLSARRQTARKPRSFD